MEEGGVIKSYLHSIKNVFEDELQVIFCSSKVIGQVKSTTSSPVKIPIFGFTFDYINVAINCFLLMLPGYKKLIRFDFTSKL